ncbi:MAG: ccmF [Gammaproteobacteria bacterium]|jgi:cytochrome c-type biogenesis protein CcmF|nr:ccmF [Gammaproteobacteria bacterium]
MIPEIGHFSLILALWLALLQFLLPLYGVWRKDATFANAAKPLALGQSCMVAIAFILLEYAFLSNDFSVAYVAQNSNTHLPLFYKMTALWSAHEGSLLLWVGILAIWTSLVCGFSKNMDETFRARVLAVMGGVSFGFLLFMLLTSNPFLRLLPNIPADGNDLNPLLQDPGLVIHPPMLYMGYVGTTVAFAFAMSALMAGKLDAAWARWSLPWSIVAWCFLTFGITLGSWWSYRDLGWGGWWFWDPVENASFMPWLVSTALIHSLVVTEKRGAFKNWTVLLAITAFILSLMGTFLVRSGILTSVHAFAVDPTRGAFLLKFLACVIMSALAIYAWRAPAIGQGGTFDFISRESLLLMNNVFLFVLMSTVLIGTLYPLILQVLNVAKISVGPPYFNMVFVPIACVMLFVMALAPASQWMRFSVKSLWQKTWLSFLLAFAAALILPWLIMQQLTWSVVVGVTLGAWIILSTLQDIIWRYQQFGRLAKSWWAMSVAHIGVALTVLGITLTANYSIEASAVMRINDIAKVGNYQLTLQSLENKTGPNYQAIAATFTLSALKSAESTQIVTEKRYYPVSQSAMSIPGIDINLWRDVYLALGEATPDQKGFEVRLYDKPFVRWIWLGGVLMILGGVIAAWPRRKRVFHADD